MNQISLFDTPTEQENHRKFVPLFSRGISKSELYTRTCKELIKSFQRADEIRKNGAHDVGWADGTNFNLVHNHIHCEKSILAELHFEYNYPLPDDFYRPTPDEVDNDVMFVEREKKPFYVENPILYTETPDPEDIIRIPSYEYDVIRYSLTAYYHLIDWQRETVKTLRDYAREIQNVNFVSCPIHQEVLSVWLKHGDLPIDYSFAGRLPENILPIQN